jgi:peptidoglycan/LPS O-acetylase OafA/YrhL
LKSHRPNQPSRHWLDPWHVDPSANRNYDFIDGLRGVAILMVVACHYIYFKEQDTLASHLLSNFIGTLGKGVNLFFTLSGFLIAWPFWKRKATGANKLIPPGYGWRRFWKIYPPLALSVLILAPIYILLEGDESQFIYTAGQWLTGLAFIIPVNGQLNPVMWSLVVEVHFYLVLPLLFLMTKPFSAKTSLWLISLFLFIVPFLISIETGVAPGFKPKIEDPFFTGLNSFCIGVAVAGLDNLKIWRNSWARLGDIGWGVMLVGLAGQVWFHMNPHFHAPVINECFQWFFRIGTGCLLCYATDPKKPVARWLCTPWLRWCGIISYEWYLFHQPMFYWARTLLGPANGNGIRYLLILGAPLAASLIVAALIYHQFSLPILKYGRSKNQHTTK